MVALLAFLLLIGTLVLVHEAGHLVAARLFGVRILRVSMGFGPPALRLQGGGTEWRIAWLPIGGYVKLLGESPEDEVPAAERGASLSGRPLWQRVVIVLAGPAFNLLLPLPLFFGAYAARARMSSAVVADLVPGQPAAEAGLRPGDRILAVDRDEVASYEELSERVADAAGRALRLTIERPGEPRPLSRYVTPRAGVLRRRFGDETTVGLIGISERARLAQVGVAAGSPAARAGLRTGDVVLAVGGAPIRTWPELERALAAAGAAAQPIAYASPGASVVGLADVALLEPRLALVAAEPIGGQPGRRTGFATGLEPGERFVRDVEPGTPAAGLGLRPGDELLTLDGERITRWLLFDQAMQARPDATFTLAWRTAAGQLRRGQFRQERRWRPDDYGLPRPRLIFGVRTHRLLAPPTELPIPNRLGYAADHALARAGAAVWELGRGLGELVLGARPTDQLGGPVMIFLLTEGAARHGPGTLAELVALVSINLGLLNLLPVPLLDGGHLLFYACEAARRRPLSARARAWAGRAGAALVGCLMLLALRNDVLRLFLR